MPNFNEKKTGIAANPSDDIESRSDSTALEIAELEARLAQQTAQMQVIEADAKLALDKLAAAYKSDDEFDINTVDEDKAEDDLTELHEVKDEVRKMQELYRDIKESIAMTTRELSALEGPHRETVGDEPRKIDQGTLLGQENPASVRLWLETEIGKHRIDQDAEGALREIYYNFMNACGLDMHHYNHELIQEGDIKTIEQEAKTDDRDPTNKAGTIELLGVKVFDVLKIKVRTNTDSPWNIRTSYVNEQGEHLTDLAQKMIDRVQKIKKEHPEMLK